MTAIQRAALLLALVFLSCCGGLGGLAAIGASVDAPQGEPAPNTDTSVSVPEEAVVASATPVATTPTSIAALPPLSATTEPVVEKRTVRETRAIPFRTRTVEDPSRPEGTRTVRVKGVAGVRTLTYEVTVTDGVQTSKKLVSSVVTRRPVTKVIAVGTKSEPQCDPNYSGECVPIASDVDCGGGSGNGPAYVYGVVKVIGIDIYDLDRDNDGYGCD